MKSRTAPKNTASRKRKAAVINLRMPAEVRDLIDTAADVQGKTRTAFIVESSRKEAIDVLLDQRFFALNNEQYDAFVKALDEPPAPNAKLKQLLASRAPWER